MEEISIFRASSLMALPDQDSSLRESLDSATAPGVQHVTFTFGSNTIRRAFRYCGQGVRLHWGYELGMIFYL